MHKISFLNYNLMLISLSELRCLKELLPLLHQYLTTQSAVSERASPAYLLSSHLDTQLHLLRDTLPSLLPALSLPSKDMTLTLTALSPYLSTNQPRCLADAASHIFSQVRISKFIFSWLLISNIKFEGFLGYLSKTWIYYQLL